MRDEAFPRENERRTDAAAAPMSDTTLTLTLYEPRWHGFAKWTLDRRWPVPGGMQMVEAVHSGFVRRATRGVKKREFAPMQWISRPTARKLARTEAK